MEAKKNKRKKYRVKKTFLRKIGIGNHKKSRRSKYKRKKFIKNKDNRLFVVLLVSIILLIFNLALLSHNRKVELKKKEQQKIKLEKAKKEKARKEEERLKKEEEIKREQERIENLKNSIKYGDIVFLGDSITEYYNLENYYSYPIINSGTAGWTTDQILPDLYNKVYKYDVKKVFILIGTNDLNLGKNPQYIENNIELIIKRILARKPNVKIYLESIYPINNTSDSKINHDTVGIRKNETITEINGVLQKYCEENNVTYINLYDKLVDKEGNLNIDYTKEGLHITDEGYKVITKELESYILEKEE